MFVTWQMCDKSWQGFVTRDFAFKSSHNSRTILVVESIGVLRLSVAGIVITGGWTVSMTCFCRAWQIPWQKFVTRLSRACHRAEPPLPICDMVQKWPKWHQGMCRNCLGPSWHSENVSDYVLSVFGPILACDASKCLWYTDQMQKISIKTYMIPKLQIVSSSEHQKVWANSSWALRTIRFPSGIFLHCKKIPILE